MFYLIYYLIFYQNHEDSERTLWYGYYLGGYSVFLLMDLEILLFYRIELYIGWTVTSLVEHSTPTPPLTTNLLPPQPPQNAYLVNHHFCC